MEKKDSSTLTQNRTSARGPLEIEYERIHIRPNGLKSNSLDDRREFNSISLGTQKINRNDIGQTYGSKKNFEMEFNRAGGKKKFYHHRNDDVVKTYLDNPSMNEQSIRGQRPKKKPRKYLQNRDKNRGIAGGDQRLYPVAHRKKSQHRRNPVDDPNSLGSSRRRRRWLLSDNDFASVGECEERRRNKLRWHYVSRSNKKRKKRMP